MKNIILLCTLVLSFNLQAEITADLSRCTEINNKDDRLNCFDTVAAYYKQHGSEINKTVEGSVASTTPRSDADTIVITKENAFGKSVAELTEIESINSTIVGEFTGWKKGEVIILANGQKWKVTSSSKGYTKMNNPKVEVSQGFWGSFNMKVDGLNSKAKVKRVD